MQTLIFPRTRRTINETADALLAINNDIVDISKLDVGHLTMEPRQFDLNSFFHNSVELFITQAASKGIYLDVIQDEVFPKDAIGDSGRIRQILLNVIGNAIKFTSQGGVTLKVNVSETQSRYSVKVDVINTGIGVSGDRTAQILKNSNKQIVEQPANSVELRLASRFRANLRGSWMAIS